jgi:hypothetical protein
MVHVDQVVDLNKEISIFELFKSGSRYSFCARNTWRAPNGKKDATTFQIIDCLREETRVKTRGETRLFGGETSINNIFFNVPQVKLITPESINSKKTISNSCKSHSFIYQEKCHVIH